ncbi:MAG: hypothetical protein COA97_00555 [Flavobacteriales bacterium]|nr:MAG: hypothetical protein COA97_00555 [Flavobacteriales bacterium]
MKEKILILTVLFLTTFISCSKVNNKNMTVIKDCTGSYLRFNDKDYQVCNIEVVENFDNGTEVKASFKKIDKCENNWGGCNMLHQNEGWINVRNIK